jgi:hypothetical protein
MVFQGSILTWRRMWLNTPHFCQSTRGSVYKVLSRSLEGITDPQKELLLEAVYGLVALEQVSLKDFNALLDPHNPTLRKAIANTRRVEEPTRLFWRDYDNDSTREASASALRKKFVDFFHEPLVSLFASHAFSWGELLGEHSVILTFPVAVVDTAQTPDPVCRYTWHSAARASDCCWLHTTRPPSA